MVLRNKKSDIRGGLALKVWGLALSGVDCEAISNETRYSEETIRLYLESRGMINGCS